MLFRGIVLAGLVTLGSHAGCGEPTEFVLDAAVADATTLGQVSLAWTVVDLEGRPVGCDRISARTVALQLRNRAGVGGSLESFSCANSPSTTRSVESGTYNVTFQLNGDDGTLAMATDQTGVVIASGQITPLTAVEFRVETKGSLALSIATPPGASNCKPPAMGGAGITGMAISLVGSSGSCAPVKLLRSRGSTPLGSFTVACGSPQFGSCIENDETLTPEVPMDSDVYKIQIRGRILTTECFRAEEDLRVPAARKVLTRTVNLANLCAPAAG